MASPSIHAMKDGDVYATEFASTTAGLQAAIDYLAGGKGKVFIGPGTLSTTTAIWLHSYCHVQGSGRGVTVIQRAAGSITDSDAANSGAVFATSAYGSNGTISTYAAPLYDITISDITLDGNQTVFQALTSGTPFQAGILAQGVVGLRIERVACNNTIRSGYFLSYCKDVMCNDVEGEYNGVASFTSTNNCFDFYNSSANAVAAGLACNYTLTNFRVKATQDEAISVTSVQDVAISNGVIDTCDYCLEIQAVASTQMAARISMTNVVGKNLLQWPIAIFNGTSYQYEDIVVADCVFSGDSTLHNGGALTASVSQGGIKRLTVANCHFYNMNTLDSTNRAHIDLTNVGSSSHDGISISNCSIRGKASGAVTTYGALVVGNVTNATFDNVRVLDATVGFAVFGQSGITSTTSYIRYIGCRAENLANHGFVVGANTATTTISDVEYINCGVIDAGLVTSGSNGFQVQNTAAGATSRIRVHNCWIRKVNAGANFNSGMRLQVTTGTTDDVVISDNRFNGVTNQYAFSGTPTNVHFTPPQGLGTAITAAATIAIPVDGTTHHVTGNTNITNGITVNPWDNGRTVTLIFDGTPTVSDTGTSKLNAAFVATADDTLTLVCDGTNWYEVGNSAN